MFTLIHEITGKQLRPVATLAELRLLRVEQERWRVLAGIEEPNTDWDADSEADQKYDLEAA